MTSTKITHQPQPIPNLSTQGLRKCLRINSESYSLEELMTTWKTQQVHELRKSAQDLDKTVSKVNETVQGENQKCRRKKIIEEIKTLKKNQIKTVGMKEIVNQIS